MKFKYLMFLLLNMQLVSCQVKKEKNIIFLGELTAKNQYKVLLNDSITYVDRNALKDYDTISNKEFIKLFPTEKFVKVLDSLGLYFLSEGNEPFWNIKIKGKKAYFNKRTFNIKTSFQENDHLGTNFMFKSLDGNLFGIISSEISYNYIPKKPSCSLWNTEKGNDSYYSIFFSIEGVMYNGCVRIGNNFYDE